MSILYKGLNPKNHYGLCILTKDGELITADGKHYQAIQIPTPHGRLIDEKTLDDTIERVHILTRYEHKIVSNILFETPTILEAEE